MDRQAPDGSAGAPASPRFRTDIQGLRAIAVALVVAYHAGVPGIDGGYIGVDVFFVISGFLITSHLVDGLAGEGGPGFRTFYARRIRRILPVAIFVLLVTLVASFVVLPPLQIESVVREAVATALYVPNVLFAWRSTDYLADPTPSPYQHYWSLGVEEQFYLLWPLALFLVWWVARARRTVVLVAVGALVLASFGLCLVFMTRSQPYAFFLLPTRAWELGVGGLVAIAAAQWSPRADGSGRMQAAGGWVGLLAVVWAGVAFSDETWFPGYAALVPVLGTAAVIWCGITAPGGGPTRALSVRPAQWIGLLSYSIYLWHWPLLVLGAAAAGEALDLATRVALAAAAVPLAALSFRFVEQPFRLSPRLATRPGTTIGLALGATGMVVALVLAAGAVWERRPLHGGPPVAAAPLTVPPAFEDVVPRNLTPSLRAVDDDLPVVYDRDCHLDWPESTPSPCTLGDEDADRTLVLFGDSHAAQWVPALEAYADQHDLALVTHTKRSCPSVDMPKDNQGNPFTACDEWRDAVLDDLAADPPALVVLANARGHEPSAGGSAAVAWNEGLARTLDRLPAESPALVIADTPAFPETPSLCLSEHLDDTAACTWPRDEVLDASWRDREEATALAHDAMYVDLGRYLCSDVCGPVIGPYLVYRDRNHLSTSMSAALAGPLDDDFAAAGVSWRQR